MSYSITFYLAAKYSKRTELLPIAALLMMNGHYVRAEWLNGSHSGTSDSDKDLYAKTDLADIDACSHFVMFQLPVDAPEYSTGRQIELGYALAKGKSCIVIGDGESVFYSQVKRFATVVEFLESYAPNGRIAP